MKTLPFYMNVVIWMRYSLTLSGIWIINLELVTLFREDLKAQPCRRKCVTGLWSFNPPAVPRSRSLLFVVWDVSSQLLRSPCLHAAMLPHCDGDEFFSPCSQMPQINPSFYKLPWSYCFMIAVGWWINTTGILSPAIGNIWVRWFFVIVDCFVLWDSLSV